MFLCFYVAKSYSNKVFNVEKAALFRTSGKLFFEQEPRFFSGTEM